MSTTQPGDSLNRFVTDVREYIASMPEDMVRKCFCHAILGHGIANGEETTAILNFTKGCSYHIVQKMVLKHTQPEPQTKEESTHGQ